MSGHHPDEHAADDAFGEAAIEGLEGWLAREAERQRVEVEEHPRSERAHDFVVWWLRSARLAVLGHPSNFDRWPRLAAETGVDVIVALQEAGREAIEVLADARGERLAEALIDAEDAACLVALEPERTALLPPAALTGVPALWREAAAEALMDADARALLARHRRAWRMPPSFGLPVIDAGLDELELRLAVADCPPPVRLAPVFSYAEEVATFDSGRPTEGMIRRFAERRGEGTTRDGRDLRVEGVLDPHWRVTVWIRGAATEVIRSVRLGMLALAVDPDFEGSESDVRPYFATLAGLPIDVRTRLVSSEIAVATEVGDRFLL